MKRWVILLLCMLAILYSAQAGPGCFLSPNSPFYCQTIDQAEAQTECEQLQNCDLNDIFQEAQSCEGTPECEQILCKSTCTTTYSGLCPSGPLDADEQEQWCSPGCCRIHYEGGNVCNYLPTKGLCEREAQSWEQSAFNYDITLDKTSCEEYCAPLRSLAADPFEHLPQQRTTAPIPLIKDDDTNGKPTAAAGLSSRNDPPQNTDSSNSSFGLLIPLVIVLLAGLIFFAFHNKKKIAPSAPASTDQTPAEQLPESIQTSAIDAEYVAPDQPFEPVLPLSLDPLPSLPHTLEQNPTLPITPVNKRQQRDKDKTSMKLAFGTSPKKLSGTLRTLDRLVKNHEQNQAPATTPTTFERLRSLTRKK